MISHEYTDKNTFVHSWQKNLELGIYNAEPQINLPTFLGRNYKFLLLQKSSR